MEKCIVTPQQIKYADANLHNTLFKIFICKNYISLTLIGRDFSHKSPHLQKKKETTHKRGVNIFARPGKSCYLKDSSNDKDVVPVERKLKLSCIKRLPQLSHSPSPRRPAEDPPRPRPLVVQEHEHVLMRKQSTVQFFRIYWFIMHIFNMRKTRNHNSKPNARLYKSEKKEINNF